MKSGIRVLFDEFFDNSLASSSLMTTIVRVIKNLSLEAKKIDDKLSVLSSRLDVHERIIQELCDEKREEPTFDHRKRQKEGVKPN